MGKGQRFVAYYRVSTARQGQSGLGLAGQRAQVEAFAKTRGGVIVAEYTEVESRRRNDRPQALAALKRCRTSNACLLTAKIDRLSGSITFLGAVLESRVRWVSVDYPEMDELVVTVMTAVARRECRAISERTKAALAAAKARGQRLGTPANLPPGTREGASRASAAHAAKAKVRAREYREAIDDARAAGAVTLRDVAAHLNGLGYRSPRGSEWTACTVQRTLAKLAA